GPDSRRPPRDGSGWPTVPGYEIVGELGRGGMGVVYKARHRQLNRLVALKMVLAGGYASQGERQRLRTEAEAIAHLQHAHIVQIYEVGECDGRPFLALEFCAGGSLDRKLAGVPLPPVEAAQLVQTLAQAVHAAHQHHVIHRDLKPANVLLTEDGTVKITDFGLAKRLDVEQALTQSGAIMGTPSYMAPEQAQGERGQVGPATDVYALGAILYEVLTGRPPFKAPSVVDTLAQVVQVEPVAPSRLQAKVPRDLETVCLKCLQKEPGRRYASAWDLAEDLRRFQAGEPILARPVGRLERGWRWCRRNPALAVLSAAIVLLLVGSLAGMTGLYLNAEDERRQAETERTLADAQRRRAEGERQRADDERDRAKKHADEAKSQKQVADEQRTVAHDEADRARQVSQFLAAMFGASDPLGLNTLMFNLNPRTGEELTASAILDLGYKRIAGDKQLSPRVRADILDTIGNVYRSRGQREEAEPLLNEALKLRRAAKAPPGELAASLHSLAWLHHERGNYPTAIKLYREALQLRETEAERDEVAIANHQFNLAWVLTEIEQYDEAEQLLRKVIARRLARFGPDHRETALAKAALAAVYLDAGRDAAALPLVQEAMTAFGKLSEDKNIQQAMTKFQQGVLWGRMFGDQAAAEKHLRDSLAFARKSLDAKHILVLYPLVQLGLTLEKRKKYDEAEELLREAVAIGRGRFGSGHPKSLSVVPPLARLLRKRGAGQEADALFEELVAGHKQRFGEA
ncbi:MAG TPA: serine/threonine-protein kinase, partial [Gemmataceae bacterium]|nr:serine/threonine-protein kinase [Gemmataceae bacterium]